MATEAELAFADKVGRFFARQYGMPPATGKVIGWMLIVLVGRLYRLPLREAKARGRGARAFLADAVFTG